MNMPRNSGKIGLSKIKDIPVEKFKDSLAVLPTRYVANIEERQLDFLWYPKENSNRIFVLFSGDAQRDKNEPPVFQRWSWASFFPGHCVYVSDPTITLSNTLSLGWYAGDQEFDPISLISKLLIKICHLTDIDPVRVTSYGSSGGGFAALRFLSVFKSGQAVAINPQTSIQNYHKRKVEHFLKECYHGVSEKEVFQNYISKMDVSSFIDEFDGGKIIYVQNVEDEFHLKNHAEPFFRKINDYKGIGNIDLKKIFFESDGGHAKAETPEVFKDIMKEVTLK